MAHPAGKKEESRARILAGAGRGFRGHGYGGLGVDALAKEAGVTSGAFYAHFKSKADAFREAVSVGLNDLKAGVERIRADRGKGWLRHFVNFYLGDRRTSELAESCALQSLTNEVTRADPSTRQAYEAALKEVIAAVADGLEARTASARRTEAIALLALLSGAVSMARAVDDEKLAEEIAAAAASAAERLSAVVR